MKQHGTTIPPYVIPARLANREPIKRPRIIDPSCILALFPEESTTWKDYSRYGNDGTLTNAIWTNRGRRRDAVYFNGVNAIVDCGAAASLELSDYQSVACWVKFFNLEDAQIVWCNDVTGVNNTTITLGIKPDDDYIAVNRIGTTFGGTLSTSGITANKWVHLVHTWNIGTDTVRFFVNAKEITCDVVGFDYGPAGDQFSIGGRTTTYFFKGWIDQFMVFNRLLTPSEIQNMYEQGL